MSRFEKENNEVFQMVRQNHHRSEVCQTIGYIVTEEQARQLVKRGQKQELNLRELAFAAVAVVAIAVTALVAVL